MPETTVNSGSVQDHNTCKQVDQTSDLQTSVPRKWVDVIDNFQCVDINIVENDDICTSNEFSGRVAVQDEPFY